MMKSFSYLRFALTLFLLIVFTHHLNAAPNYYYSAISYRGYLNQRELQQDDLSAKIETYLRKPVPGLDATYRELIDALIAKGHHVYLRGGLIRDLLSISPTEPNDVDLDYTGTVDDLIAVLKANHWQYTHFPNRQLVMIGNGAIDAMPVKLDEQTDSVASLEFTMNNIFYHCNTKSFLESSQTGLNDLSYDRIHILTDDWKLWMDKENAQNYNKIFRFWKMVGKGYVYSKDLHDFFLKETNEILRDNPIKFQANLFTYLSHHMSGYDDILRGATAIMGYRWSKENISDNLGTLLELYVLFESEREHYTYHP